ncbi:MAG: glycosyltransferase family 8 protein [Candidatus Tokpelaia sp.]|nr:MAG: glycosyltransferase family 8 protein [Candidatus Tokpelaia sp.]
MNARVKRKLLSVPSVKKVKSPPVVPKRREVPVVFCGDAHYGPYLPVAVQSLIDHASDRCHYQIIILDCGIEQDITAALQRQIRQCENFSLHIKNMAAYLQRYNSIFRERHYFTQAIYGRLLIPQLCRGYDKVIYADIDMIFNRDIAELMAIDLGGNYIAAVPDALLAIERLAGERNALYIENIAGLSPRDIYVNSGLLVFNARLWRKDRLINKILRFIEGKKLLLPDQDAINAVCKGRIHYLPQAWNCLNRYYLDRWLAKSGREQQKHPAIAPILAEWQAAQADKRSVYHYNGPLKPWGRAAADKAALWWHYAAKTELYPRYIYNLAAAPALDEAGNRRTVYKFLGLAVWAVKQRGRESLYLLAGKLRLAKKVERKNAVYIYIFGLKLFAINRRQG